MNYHKTNFFILLVLLFITELILSSSLSFKVYEIIDKSNKSKFINSANTIIYELESGFNKYAIGLKSIEGVLASHNNQLTSEDFRKYAKSNFFFKQQFPGSFGFGFIFYVKKENFSSYLKAATNRQGANFIVKTDHQYNDYFIIEYIEPIENNGPAKGFDIGQEKRRREAAELAMKTGRMTLTKKIQLVQDNNQRAGFLFINPIYSSDEIPKTESERISQIIGFTYTPLVINEIMTNSIKNYSHFIDFKIYETSDLQASSLLFDSNENNSNTHINLQPTKQSYTKTANIDIGNQSWQIILTSKENTFDYNPLFISISVFILLCIISVLILLLLYSLIKRNDQAQLLAQDLTSQINSQKSEIEQALNQANFNLDQVKAIIDAIPGYVAWFDSDLNYLGLNQELCTLFNANENYFLGKKLGTIFLKMNEDYVKQIYEFSKSPLNYKTSFVNLEINNVTKYLMVNLRKFNNGQNIIVISIDYSEQKKAEELFQSSLAKSTYSSKMLSLGEMAGSISHEINNPLSIISSKSQLLKKQIENNNIDKALATDALDKIVLTTERINKIIRGLRVIARDGEQDILMPVNVSRLVEETLDLCSTRFKNHGISLNRNHIDPNLIIRCRETQIMQILLNLLNNAHDAVSSLTIKTVTIEVRVMDEYVDFIVTDSGSGISHEIRGKLMQPFFTTKATGQGMGLGLSISRSIAESHNGILFVNYKHPNTQFVLRLPK